VIDVEVGPRLGNRYLAMGDFTMGTMFTNSLADNGRLLQLHFPVSLDEVWTINPA
jgi:hypothetical protein